MLTTIEKVIFLQDIDIFESTTTENLAHVAAITEEVEFKKDQFIFKEGDQAKSLKVLGSGKVILEMTITRLPERDLSPRATVDVVVKGEVFGWSAVVEPHIYTTCAQAIDKCNCVTIDGGKLCELMDSAPEIGYILIRELSQVIASRLTHTRQTLLSERGLALLAEHYRY